jgi:hypothetical protein
MPADQPVVRQRAGEAHGHLWIPAKRPVDSGTDVVVISLQQAQPRRLLGTADHGLGPLGQPEEASRVPALQLVGRPRFREPLAGVPAKRFQQPETRVAPVLGDNKGLVHQAGQRFQHPGTLPALGPAHLLGGLEREAPDEHGQLAEEFSLRSG